MTRGSRAASRAFYRNNRNRSPNKKKKKGKR